MFSARLGVSGWRATVAGNARSAGTITAQKSMNRPAGHASTSAGARGVIKKGCVHRATFESDMENESGEFKRIFRALKGEQLYLGGRQSYRVL